MTVGRAASRSTSAAAPRERLGDRRRHRRRAVHARRQVPGARRRRRPVRPRRAADYRAIPAGIFTDPEIGDGGPDRGRHRPLRAAARRLAPRPTRSRARGFVRLFADPEAAGARRRGRGRPPGGRVARPADARRAGATRSTSCSTRSSRIRRSPRRLRCRSCRRRSRRLAAPCSAKSSPRSSRRSDADGSVNVDEFRELATHLVDHGSDGLVVAGTTGEARRSPTTRSSSSSRRRRRPSAIARRVVAGTGTYDTRHSVAPDEARARGRRRRHPRRHAVLQQAAAARDRPPLPGDRRATDKPVVVYNIPSRVVDQHRAGDDRASSRRSRTSRAVKQAHDDIDEARHIVPETRPRPLRGRRQPHLPVPRARRRRRHLRAHARVGPADEGDGPPLSRRRRRRRARAERGDGARVRPAEGRRRTRSRSRRR